MRFDLIMLGFALRRSAPLVAVVLLLALLPACKKEEGYGGTCTLQGKVMIQDYNGLGVLQAEYYAPDERVFIIYGADSIYSDEMRTNYDGSFRFQHLYKGGYTVFAYSDCDTCDAPDVPVMASVTFTKEKESLVTADIVVRR